MSENVEGFVCWVLAHQGAGPPKWYRWARSDLYPTDPAVQVCARWGLVVTDADGVSTTFPWPRVIQYRFRTGLSVDYA